MVGVALLERWPVVRGVPFGRSGLERRVDCGGSGLIRGVACGGSGLIRGVGVALSEG